MRDDTDNIILTTVLTDYINQVSINDVSNYAFEMEEIENDTDYFLNLVVKEYNDSYYISIVKYVPDPLWFSLNTRSQDFSSYTGNTYFYDEQGVYLANMEFTNGAASSFGYNPPCPDSDSANYLGDWIGDNFPDGDGAGLGGLPCITTWYSCNGPNADISHDEGPNSGLVGDISCGDASSGYSGSGWTMDCGDGDSGYDGTASTWDNVFNDYLSNSCGSLGSGGGNNTPLCPGVTPCIEELQSFDANCNCVNNFNPITPINSSIYYAKEVNICLGRILTTDQLTGLDNNEDFTLAVHNYLVLDNGECDPTADTDFAELVVEAGANGTLISAFPFVKYPPNSNYANLYPKLTEYLKNQLPTLKNNSTIINAIKTYTSQTTAQIQQHLQWGQGPTIRIEQLGTAYGKFKKSTDPDSLYLDIDLVNQLESTTPNSNLANAFAFLIGVTVLHEYVHYGDYNYNGDFWQYPQEEGLLFETDVYGQSVWIHNAEIILKGN